MLIGVFADVAELVLMAASTTCSKIIAISVLPDKSLAQVHRVSISEPTSTGAIISLADITITQKELSWRF